MRLLIIIEPLLLLRRKQRTDLRPGAGHDRFHFLHALAMDRSDLRLGLIDDRLNLGLLIGRQVQLVRDPSKAERVTVPAPESGSSLGLGDDKTAQRDRAGGHNC